MPKADTRRSFLKGLVVAAAALLLVPVERFAQFLWASKREGGEVYLRTRIANKNSLGVNESLLFEYPHKDRPAILIHLASGEFVAYDAICTHLGCQVHFNKTPIVGWEDRSLNLFSPCHGGVFDPTDGKVLTGPPPRPLPKIKLEFENDDIFANGYEGGLPLYGEG